MMEKELKVRKVRFGARSKGEERRRRQDKTRFSPEAKNLEVGFSSTFRASESVAVEEVTKALPLAPCPHPSSAFGVPPSGLSTPERHSDCTISQLSYSRWLTMH